MRVLSYHILAPDGRREAVIYFELPSGFPLGRKGRGGGAIPASFCGDLQVNAPLPRLAVFAERLLHFEALSAMIPRKRIERIFR